MFTTTLRRIPSLSSLAGIACICLVARYAHGQSFSVDEASVGLPGTAVAFEAPAPNHIFNALGLSSTNVVDLPPGALGLPRTAPPNLDAISAGYEPLDGELWDFIFSVDRRSSGQSTPPSAVNARASGGNAAGSDLYFTNPAHMGSNRMLWENHRFGLSNGIGDNEEGPGDNTDAWEIFDSRYGVEIPYRGFSTNEDDVYYSYSQDATIFVNRPTGLTPFRMADEMGLFPNDDDIDALALDLDVLARQPLEGGDGVVEALFSLAPDSPSLSIVDLGLGRPLSPADIFYTDFSGTFELAGPGNIHFPFDLRAENLGLLKSDNVDAIDIIQTMTTMDIPMDHCRGELVDPCGGSNPFPNPGDMDADGDADFDDIDEFVLALNNPNEYLNLVGLPPELHGDLDNDDDMDFDDISGFVKVLANGDFAAGQIANIPEPSTVVLALVGLVALMQPFLSRCRT